MSFSSCFRNCHRALLKFSSCRCALLKYYKLLCCPAFSTKFTAIINLPSRKLPGPFRTLIQWRRIHRYLQHSFARIQIDSRRMPQNSAPDDGIVKWWSLLIKLWLKEHELRTYCVVQINKRVAVNGARSCFARVRSTCMFVQWLIWL